MNGNATRLRLGEAVLIVLVLVAAFCFRATKLGGAIDEPAWRQCWAANQIRELSRESPPEWLKPKVNFRGSRDISLWNFPLYEDVVGALYKVMGGERLAVARAVTLLFFLGSAAYLYRTMRMTAGSRLAWLTVAVYALLPVGVFYSRAIHYDVSLLFFVQAYLYHGLAGFRGGSRRDLVLCGIACTMAGLIKAPYAMGAAAAIAWVVWTEQTEQRGRRCAAFVALHVAPLLGLIGMHLLRTHYDSVMAKSAVFADPYSGAYVMDWFFGSVRDRLDPAKWKVFLDHVLWRVATPFGLVAALLALVPAGRPDRAARALLWTWSAGCAAFVLVLFPILASPHDYYALPLLAPAAGWIALFLDEIAQPAARGAGTLRLGVCLLLLAAGATAGLERSGYFLVDRQQIEAARLVREHTRPGALLAVAIEGRTTGRTDPRFLYWADRKGFAARLDEIDAKRWAAYRDAGVTALAVLTPPDHPPVLQSLPVAADWSRAAWPVLDAAGARLGVVTVFQAPPSGEVP